MKKKFKFRSLLTYVSLVISGVLFSIALPAAGESECERKGGLYNYDEYEVGGEFSTCVEDDLDCCLGGS
jgi:hypothetical protein